MKDSNLLVPGFLTREKSFTRPCSERVEHVVSPRRRPVRGTSFSNRKRLSDIPLVVASDRDIWQTSGDRRETAEPGCRRIGCEGSSFFRFSWRAGTSNSASVERSKKT